MQIEILDKNNIEGKLKTRSLYEKCFDEGKKDFIDYYYTNIIKRNEIAVVIIDDKIVSMIHLNPYLYNILGQIKTIHYFVAVATDIKYRNKGYSKMLFDYAINYLKNKNEPLCYLVPDNDNFINMYKKYGFEVVANFTYDKFSKEEYDIFPVLNEEYNNLMKIEQKYLDDESIEYKEDLKHKKVMFKLLDENFNYDIEVLKNKKIYVCQEV